MKAGDGVLFAMQSAFVRSLVAPQRAAVSYGVSVPAYARVDGESRPQPLIKIVADTGREP